MNKSARGLFLAIFAVIAVFLLLNVFGNGSGLGMLGNKPKEFNYSKLLQEVESGNVKTADWQGTTVSDDLMDGTKYVAQVMSSDSQSASALMGLLKDKGVSTQIGGPGISSKGEEAQR